MQKKYIRLFMSVFLLTAMYFLAKEAAVYTNGLPQQVEERVVVIDVGHGGKDPGKVGVNGELEKDINLAIALKLEKFLKQKNVDINDVFLMTADKNKNYYLIKCIKEV